MPERDVFARSNNGNAVLAHQSANTAVPDIQTNLFQFLSHAGPAIAAQTETGLFFDVRQRHHVRSLPAAGRTTSERTQTVHAYVHNLTKARCWKRIPVFFPSHTCKYVLPGSE